MSMYFCVIIGVRWRHVRVKMNKDMTEFKGQI